MLVKPMACYFEIWTRKVTTIEDFSLAIANRFKQMGSHSDSEVDWDNEGMNNMLGCCTGLKSMFFTSGGICCLFS